MNLLAPPPSGRRGSLKQVTPASSFKDEMKNSVYQVFNVELQGKIAEVSLNTGPVSCTSS